MTLKQRLEKMWTKRFIRSRLKPAKWTFRQLSEQLSL